MTPFTKGKHEIVQQRKIYCIGHIRPDLHAETGPAWGFEKLILQGIFKSMPTLPRSLILFFVLLSTCWHVPAMAQEKYYKVAIYDNYPMVFRDAEGQPDGVIIKTLQEIARRSKWKLEFVDCELADCIDALQDAKVDIIPQIAYTIERSKEIRFSDESIALLWAEVYVHPDAKAEYSSVLSLEGRRVGVGKDSYFIDGPDYNFSNVVKEKGVVLEEVVYASYEDIFRAIEDKKVDAGIVNRIFAEMFANEYEVSKTSISFSQFFMKLAFPLEHPDADYLNETISTMIADMKEEPGSVFMTEHKKYFMRGNYTMLPSWFWIALMITFLSVGALIGINRLLRVRVRFRTKKLKIAMEQLEEETRRSRLAHFTLEKATDYVYWINEEGRFVYGNEAGMRLLGLKQQTFSLTIMDAAPEMSKAQWARHWAETKQKRTTLIEFEVPIEGRDPVPIEAAQSYINFGGKEYICGIGRDQTERRQSRKALLESNQRLELAIEGSREGIWDWNLQTNSLHFNHFAAEMLGYDLADFPDTLEGFLEYMHEDDVEPTREALIQHLRADLPIYETEYRIRARDGHWHWVLVHGRVIERDAEGRGLRAIGTHVDIHAAREATEELRENNVKIKQVNAELENNLERQTLIASVSGAFSSPEQFEYNIYQVLSMVVNHMEITHAFLIVSQADKPDDTQAFGWSSPGSIVLPAKRLVNYFKQFPEVFDQVNKLKLIRIDKENKDIGEEVIKWHKDYGHEQVLGAPVYVKDKFCGLLMLADGKEDHLWSETDLDLSRTLANIVTNAFERKLIYHALEKAVMSAEVNSNRLELAISAADMGIWEWHIESNDTYYSPEYFRLLGFETDEFVPSYEKWLNMIHSDDRERMLKKIDEQNQYLDRYLMGEYRMRRKSGEYIWVFDKSKTFFNEIGRPVSIVGIIKDITADKLAQEQQIATILATEDKERQRLAKELHDGLGQILTSISLNLVAVKKNMDGLDDKNKKRLLTALDAINQAIADTRNISHNLMPGSVEDFGYVPAVENMSGAINAASEEVKVNFYHNLQNRRLEPAMEMGLYRITQEAVNNVLRHAKATEISIQLMLYENDVVLTVEDNGKGFDTTIMDSKSGHFGLSSMENRATAAGGELYVESSPGKGTMLTVELPLKKNAIYEAN